MNDIDVKHACSFTYMAKEQNSHGRKYITMKPFLTL